MGLGSIASIAGAVVGGLGGGQNTKATTVKTWDTVPKPIQDAILNTYLPGIMAQYNKERVPTPMMRAPTDTTGPLAMKGSANLQRYSDSVGGMFQPMFPQAKTPAPQPFPMQSMPQMNGMAMLPLLAQGIGSSPKAGMQWERFINGATPEQLSQMAQTIGVGKMGTGMYGGTVVGQNGKPIDYLSLMNEVLRG